MTTEGEIIRASRELVDFGAAASSRAELIDGVFHILERTVGFDSGAVLRTTDAEWTCYRKPVADCERRHLYNTEAMLLADLSQTCGGVVLDTDVLTRGMRERLHVYDEYLRPLGAKALALVYIRRLGVVTSILGVTRYGLGRFGGSELATLRALQSTLTLIMDRDEALRDAAPNPVAPELSLRERQLIEYVGRGLQNREIGALLHTSSNTIRNQLSRMYTKLEVTNRTELVRRAVELGLLVA